MKKLKGFYAYPSAPVEIGDTIESCVEDLRKIYNSRLEVSTWKGLDIVGHFISEEVTSGIRDSDFLLADITELNFNVTYEIGYAIGQSKRVFLTKNKSIESKKASIQDVGIFDTIGFTLYQNSNELTKYTKDIDQVKPIDLMEPLNHKAPVYLLDTPFKTDWSTRIISRIKKGGFIFRSFDPNELPRLSAYDAISQVSQSYGVVIPLLSASSEGHEIHNLRAAFIAGLACGMDKAFCLIQNGDDPVPLDYRDFVNISYHPNDINEILAGFSSDVAKAFQQIDISRKTQKQSFLRSLNLGATSAENEMRDLEKYYLETDQYLKALRGEANLVVGRKGSGKSAVFLQIRDNERDKNRSKNIVLDLKPEGYKLVKFKEQILDFLEEGSYQHVITAFWEYVLLLEICYKILEKDKQRHLYDNRLFEGYRELSSLYKSDDYDVVGDFSERMSSLMEKIYSEYQAKYSSQNDVRLNSSQITELLYKHDIVKLSSQLTAYMRNKGKLWLLFDNIDKGWPTSGLQHEDLLIIRALIDATRKIERQFSRNDLQISTVIFLRNDIYELLIRETSDRGKEASVILDWTDADLLRELVRLRIVSNDLDEDMEFKPAWLKVFKSHYKGEETSQYLIDRSLMRPRFLINFINQCKSFAINLNHNLIDENDIEKGFLAYSSDILRDISYELRDVSVNSDDILYAFIGSEPEMSEEKIKTLLRNAGLKGDSVTEIFDLLLWYGFLGIKYNSNETKFIYDFNYNMQIMNGIKAKSEESIIFVINLAFRPSLLIDQ